MSDNTILHVDYILLHLSKRPYYFEYFTISPYTPPLTTLPSPRPWRSAIEGCLYKRCFVCVCVCVCSGRSNSFPTGRLSVHNIANGCFSCWTNRGASGACGCVLPTQVTNLTASGHRSSTDCTAASTDNHPHHHPLSGGLD